ncbi:trichothecene efflux pump [Paraphaeosphaeria minitans]|uniref:Trichothecene efflux pump n=1 Tax=Paraphaeosphaeria minitans TaxID=565426 RepID=A0A9P6KQU5_9PLEO|nr:trichothecene efflux pump [Paraphaeosphaeria minitans]
MTTLGGILPYGGIQLGSPDAVSACKHGTFSTGGVLYPWKSAAVIATIVVGGSTLFFVLPAYEIFIHKGRSTYLPLHLFKNIRFQSAAYNTGIAAGEYCGFSIVFPQIVQTVYYRRG